MQYLPSEGKYQESAEKNKPGGSEEVAEVESVEVGGILYHTHFLLP